MINDRNKNINVAKPSTPVEITGLQDVPNAGDRFVVFGDEKQLVKLVKNVNNNILKQLVKQALLYL